MWVRKLWMLVFLWWMVVPVAAQPSVDVQTLALEGPFQDVVIAPAGDVAAVFPGQATLNIAGIPQLEYEVDPALLGIDIMDMTTGEVRYQLAGMTDYTNDVAFTADGRVLASLQRNGIVNLWDMTQGELQKSIKTLFGLQSIVGFLEDNSTLVLLSSNGLYSQLVTLDTETGYITAVWRENLSSAGTLAGTFPEAMDGQYVAADVVPDGSAILTATANGEVSLWDPQGTILATVLPRAEQPGRFNVRNVYFADGGNYLYFADQLTEQIVLYNVAAREAEVELSAAALDVAFSPDRTQVAWVDQDAVWLTMVDNPSGLVQIIEIPDHVRLLANASTLQFTPDGNKLIVGGFNRSSSETSPIPLYVVTLE